MAVTYTTVPIVKKRVKNISDDLEDADLEQFIYEAEAIVDATMKGSLIELFDATKHAILRSLATDIAALKAITYNPGTTFLSLDDANATAEMLNTSIARNLTILSDPRAVAYLISLSTPKETMNKVSTTTVAFNAVAATTLFTVPAGQIFIPVMVVIRAGADAAETDVTFGRVGALTDWLGTTQLDNLDADGDQVKIEQSNVNPPTKAKTYAAGVVFQIDVTVAAGGATNYVDLFGYLVAA